MGGVCSSGANCTKISAGMASWRRRDMSKEVILVGLGGHCSGYTLLYGGHCTKESYYH